MRLPREIDGARVIPERALHLSAHHALVPAEELVSPGSEIEPWQQTRLFETRDGGQTFCAVPLRLCWWQRWTVCGRFSWPPETIDAVLLRDNQLEIQFEDSWLEAPRSQWEARQDPKSGHWRMKRRRTG